MLSTSHVLISCVVVVSAETHWYWNAACHNDALGGFRRKILTSTTQILSELHDSTDYVNPSGFVTESMVMLSRDIVQTTITVMDRVYSNLCVLFGCQSCGLKAEGYGSEPALQSASADAFKLLSEQIRFLTNFVISAMAYEEQMYSAAASEEKQQTSRILEPSIDDWLTITSILENFWQSQFLQDLDALVAANDPDHQVADIQELTAKIITFSNTIEEVTKAAVDVTERITTHSRVMVSLPTGFEHTDMLLYLRHKNTSKMQLRLGFSGNNRHKWPFRRTSAICGEAQGPLNQFEKLEGVPRRDATGIYSLTGASLESMWELVSRSGIVRSFRWWSVKNQETYTEQHHCINATGLEFDLAGCLEQLGMNGAISWVDPRQGLHLHSKLMDVRHKRKRQNDPGGIGLLPVEGTSGSPFAVDVMVFSPLVGNCALIPQLLGNYSSQNTVHFLYVPINPVVPPPLESVPNFTRFWWHQQSIRERARSIKNDSDSIDTHIGEKLTSLFVPAQCSLESAVRMLANINVGYDLLHVEHMFAVFISKVAKTSIERHADSSYGYPVAESDNGRGTFEIWRQGWFCTPFSRYMLDLETVAGFDIAWINPVPRSTPSFCSFLRVHAYLDEETLQEKHKCQRFVGEAESSAGSVMEALRLRLRAMWARNSDIGSETMMEKQIGEHRVYCDSITSPDTQACFCLPPYRGLSCVEVDDRENDTSRPYKAAIAYVWKNTSDISHLELSLVNMWVYFNSRYDYPILIFHSGLKGDDRENLVLVSQNRVWFFRIDFSDKAKVNEETPIPWLFKHPAVQSLEFVWFVEGCVRFDSNVKSDPFLSMYRSPATFASHGSPGTVSSHPLGAQRMWNLVQAYLLNRGISLDSEWTALDLLAETAIARVIDFIDGRPVWKGDLLPTECEIVRVRSVTGPSSTYEDFFDFARSHEVVSWSGVLPSSLRTLGLVVAAVVAKASGNELRIMELPYPCRAI